MEFLDPSCPSRHAKHAEHFLELEVAEFEFGVGLSEKSDSYHWQISSMDCKNKPSAGSISKPHPPIHPTGCCFLLCYNRYPALMLTMLQFYARCVTQGVCGSRCRVKRLARAHAAAATATRKCFLAASQNRVLCVAGAATEVRNE